MSNAAPVGLFTKAGAYLLIEAEDYDAGVAELPVFPWDKKKIAPCFPMRFKVEHADQPRKITLRPADPGAKLDRLQIERLGR